MTDWFDQLRQDRLEWLESTRKNNFERGIFASVVDKYPDPVHFVYELLQNAEDQGASEASIRLEQEHLIFEHNGEPFTARDIESITGIGNTQKAEQANKIGRFGIGFKSVFVTSDRPEIYAPLRNSAGEIEPFALAIENLVVPSRIDRSDTLQPVARTRFRLPFKQAVTGRLCEMIELRLRSLGADVLLFLRHLKRIDWVTPEGRGTYSCSKDANGSALLESEIAATGQETELRQVRYRIWEQEVDWPGADRQLHIRTAFRANEAGRLVPDGTAGKLDVYFPTDEPTRLRFRLHGPFLLTDNRANVKQGDAFNEHLIQRAAQLVVSSVLQMRDLGLLDTGSLQTLPIREEDFPPASLFRPVFDAVTEAMSKEALIPAHGGGYVSAAHAKLARASDLLDLISEEQLSLGLGANDLRWVSGDITENRTYDVWRYLRHTLRVQDLRPEDFLRVLKPPFFPVQTDEWMDRFYQFVADESRISLWKHPWSLLRSQAFLRLENGTHTTPPLPDLPNHVFLPVEGTTGYNTIKRSLCTDPKVLAFLRAIGIGEPDIVAEVAHTVLPRYQRGEMDVLNEAAILKDLVLILRAVQTARNKGATAFVTQVAETPFLRGVNSASGELAWKRASELYLRTEELALYFEGCPEGWFLDPLYKEHCTELAGPGFGVASALRVHCRPAGWNDFVKITTSHSNHRRGLQRFDPDCYIVGLAHALSYPTIERSRYIWNQVLPHCSHQIHGIVERSTRQTYEGSVKESQLSIIGQQLTGIPWLPDRYGQWHCPSSVALEDLPDGFDPSEMIASQLGLRSSALGQLARQKNVAADKLQFLVEHIDDPELERFFAKRKQKQLKEATNASESRSSGEDHLEQFDNTFNRQGTPSVASHGGERVGGPVANPEIRIERLQQQLQQKKAEPRPEPRVRLVPQEIWEGKDQTVRTKIREYYDGRCQICSWTFFKANGEPYFEGLYLVSRTSQKWLDHPGNVLCLCPNCCAKMQHGTKECPDVAQTILGLDIEQISEAGIQIPMKLCGTDVVLRVCPAHVLDIRAILQESQRPDEPQLASA